MIAEKRKMLKLKGNKIYKLIPECDFAQGLNFFYCKRNTLINIIDIINVNKIKSKEFFIKAFFSIFV